MRDSITNKIKQLEDIQSEIFDTINPIFQKWMVEVKGRKRVNSIDADFFEPSPNGLTVKYRDYDSDEYEIIPWEFIEKQNVEEFKQRIEAERAELKVRTEEAAKERDRALYESLKKKFEA